MSRLTRARKPKPAAVEIVARFIGTGDALRLRVSIIRRGRTIANHDFRDPRSEPAGPAAKLLAAAAGTASLAPRIGARIRAQWKLRHKADAGDDAPAPAEPAAVVDTGAVVRPELFHTPHVTGLCVPVTVAGQDGNHGQWRLYLHRASGLRECLPLPPSIETIDPASSATGRIYIDPAPPPPTVATDPRWSAPAREAWLAGAPEPDPHAIASLLVAQIGQQIDFSSPKGPAAHEWASLLALWIILTYCYPVSDTCPYLNITGAPGSGKTKLLELIAALCFRPLVTSNITASSLFRTLHERGGTLLLDEAETIGTAGGEVAEVRNVLLAGYKRFGRATRTLDAGVSDFAVYGPKAIAAITPPTPTLASRCIQITLLRRHPASLPLPTVRSAMATLATFRDELHAAALGSLPAATAAALAGEGNCTFDGRNFDVWAPILAVAAWADAKNPAEPFRTAALAVARHCMATATEERLPEGDAAVLAALRQLVREGREPTNQEVLDRARLHESESVRNWTTRRVSEGLHRYGLRTERTTNGRRKYRGLTDADFERIERQWACEITPASQSAAVTVNRY